MTKAPAPPAMKIEVVTTSPPLFAPKRSCYAEVLFLLLDGTVFTVDVRLVGRFHCVIYSVLLCVVDWR